MHQAVEIKILWIKSLASYYELGSCESCQIGTQGKKSWKSFKMKKKKVDNECTIAIIRKTREQQLLLCIQVFSLLNYHNKEKPRKVFFSFFHSQPLAEVVSRSLVWL